MAFPRKLTGERIRCSAVSAWFTGPCTPNIKIMIMPTTDAVVITGTKYMVRYTERAFNFSSFSMYARNRDTASSKGTIIAMYLKLLINAFQNNPSPISSL